MQDTHGGDFCDGFTAGVLIYNAGVIANLWNPVGQATAAVGVGIAAACWLDII